MVYGGQWRRSGGMMSKEHDKCQHVALQPRRAGTRRKKTSLSLVSVAVAQLMRPLPPDLFFFLWNKPRKNVTRHHSRLLGSASSAAKALKCLEINNASALLSCQERGRLEGHPSVTR